MQFAEAVEAACREDAALLVAAGLGATAEGAVMGADESAALRGVVQQGMARRQEIAAARAQAQAAAAAGGAPPPAQ